MPNWCSNYVQFKGNNTEKVMVLFREMAKQCEETGQGQVPAFIQPDQYPGNPYLFDIYEAEPAAGKKSTAVNYNTKWSPNTEALVDIAKHFKVDFEQHYEEGGMGIYGRAFYKNGELQVFDLDEDTLQKIDYNEETDMYRYEGEDWESQYELIELLLDKQIEQAKQTHT